VTHLDFSVQQFSYYCLQQQTSEKKRMDKSETELHKFCRHINTIGMEEITFGPLFKMSLWDFLAPLFPFDTGVLLLGDTSSSVSVESCLPFFSFNLDSRVLSLLGVCNRCSSLFLLLFAECGLLLEIDLLRLGEEKSSGFSLISFVSV
jgi:hypothetical protein